MLDTRLTYSEKAQKYHQLLVVLVAVFLLAPFFKYGIGGLTIDLLLFSTIVFLIRSFAISKYLLWFYIAIASFAISLQISISLGQPIGTHLGINLFSHIILVLYIGGATYLISRDVFTTIKITVDTLRGGVCIYLLIGFAWALVYGMLSTINTAAFSQPLLFSDSYLKMFHFSFTTLTALGFGDIVPVSEVAQVLTNLEAITGQMYPAVFISFLMNGYLTHRANQSLVGE